MSHRNTSRPVAGSTRRRGPQPAAAKARRAPSRPAVAPAQSGTAAGRVAAAARNLTFSRAARNAFIYANRKVLIIVAVVLAVLSWVIALEFGPSVSGLW